MKSWTRQSRILIIVNLVGLLGMVISWLFYEEPKVL
jgi:hypothetical protein